MKLGNRAGRWLLAAAAGGCAIMLPGAAQAALAHPAASAARHAKTPVCETPGLVVWLDTQGNGTAGSTFYNLEFTNLSGHSCTVNGFPFIHGVSLSGANLGSRAAFTGTAHAVTLANGQTGKAQLQVVDTGALPPSGCNAVTAAGFKVYPPNQTTFRHVPFPFSACSTPGPVYLRVGPVTS